ncbi:hypothetical protein AGR1B_Cc140187 [Agrobacterium fabacearum S56]|nr:hypothetical protein AGR1B_Cc140187 [Agrobacterium fabacearum S56]
MDGCIRACRPKSSYRPAKEAFFPILSNRSRTGLERRSCRNKRLSLHVFLETIRKYTKSENFSKKNNFSYCLAIYNVLIITRNIY